MNGILNTCVLETAKLELVERVSKNGNSYKACMLVTDNGSWQIGFEKDYFVLKKYIGGIKS